MNKIENFTTYSIVSKVETLLEILSINGITIQIKKLIDNDKFLGLIQPVPNRENIYELYLKDNLFKSEVNEILAHEFVHLKQYVTGRLVRTDDKIYWEGKEYKYDKYDSSSPWEKEAYKEQTRLKRLIR